jgi:hypothetical protein
VRGRPHIRNPAGRKLTAAPARPLASVRGRALLDSRAFRDSVCWCQRLSSLARRPERDARVETKAPRRNRSIQQVGFGSLVAWVGSRR